MIHKLKFHTGPTIVKQIAMKISEAGFKISCIGTEFVYLEVDCPGDHIDARILVLDNLKSHHGTSFGLK